jgi:hypothetical protein
MPFMLMFHTAFTVPLAFLVYEFVDRIRKKKVIDISHPKHDP